MTTEINITFYTAYYTDLSGLNDEQAIRHFAKFGESEGRYPTPAALIDALEAQFGPLEIEIDSYIDTEAEHNKRPSDWWEVVETHLRNRQHTETYKSPANTKLITQHPKEAVVRSWIEENHKHLAKVFSGFDVNRNLVRSVLSLSRLVSNHITAASFLLDNIILCRFLLSEVDHQQIDLRSLSGQLYVIYYVIFNCGRVARSTAEMGAVNRALRAAINTEVMPSCNERPGVTIFMLAVRVAAGLEINNPARDAEQYLADFFGRQVLELDLQPFVTSEQRVKLRATADPPHTSVPLAAVYRWMAGPLGFPNPSTWSDTTMSYDAWFWDEGVWTFNLDYILAPNQMETLTVRVENKCGQNTLSGPQFLDRNIQDIKSIIASHKVLIGLTKFINEECMALKLPRSIIHPSALALIRNCPPVSGDSVGEFMPKSDLQNSLNLRLQHGRLVVFGRLGNGAAYCIGQGWQCDSVEHTWEAKKAACCAFRLAPEDEGPLELFLDVDLLNRPNGAWLSIAWNGKLVAECHPPNQPESWIRCYLGAHHRTGREANVLSLMLRSNHVQASGEMLGPPRICLRRLIFVNR